MSSPLRIALPYQDLQQGGMFSFLRNFRRFLDGRRIEVVPDLEAPSDVLLLNSWVLSYSEVLRAKARHPALRVLHRIDGSARNYGRDPVGDTYQHLLNHLADVTVFQSRYGRRITHLENPIIPLDGPIVYNPVDPELFSPEGERLPLEGKVRIAHVTFSTNPRKGTASICRVASLNPDLDFFLIGRYEALPALKNLHMLGHLTWDRLPAALRSCHYFAIFSENETCPNVVLEAMASGLPILYLDSGGVSELVGPSGAAVTPDDFRRVFDEAHPRHEELARSARERAVDEFGPDRIFSQYLDAFKTSRRRPLPGFLDRLVHRAHWRWAPRFTR